MGRIPSELDQRVPPEATPSDRRLDSRSRVSVHLRGTDDLLLAALGAALETLGWTIHRAGHSARPPDPRSRWREVLVLDHGDHPSTSSILTPLPPGTVTVGPRSQIAPILATISLGASAAIDSEQPFHDVLAQLDDRLRRDPPADRAVLADRLRASASAAQTLERLTPREESVLSRLMEGMTASEIAVSSHVSISTVRSQIRAVLTKLDVASQLAAVTFAHRFAQSGRLRASIRNIHQW